MTPQFFERVRNHMESRPYTPKTFDLYGLKGTPSTLLIDKKGILRHLSIGYEEDLEDEVAVLLKEGANDTL